MDDVAEARAYEEGDFRRVNRAFARRLLRTVGVSKGRAVDLGTGPAAIPMIFLQLAPMWRVLAVDASPTMLNLARRAVSEAGLEKRIELRRGDCKALGRLGTRFDLVFSNSLLHHVEDPLALWHEVKRITRPGGKIVIQDLTRPRNRAELRHLVRRHAGDASPLLRQLFHQSLLAAFTPAEVREQLQAAGLEHLRVRKTTDRHLVISGQACQT